MACALQLDFYWRTWGTVALPMTVVLLLMFLGTKRCMGIGWQAKKAPRLLTYAVVVAFLFYPPVVEALLSVFVCHGTPVEGTRYLVADLSVPCFDEVHIRSAVGSTVLLLLFALGLPSAIMMLL